MFTRAQMEDAFRKDLSQLKADLTEVKAGVAGLRGSVADLRRDVATLSRDLHETKHEVLGAIGQLTHRLEQRGVI